MTTDPLPAQLALAAYNAGPAPVAACGCVPAYPETQAYVARILALLDGAGVYVAPPLGCASWRERHTPE